MIAGLLTDLSIVLLVGFFHGVNREFDRYYSIKEREDLYRRGFIL